MVTPIPIITQSWVSISQRDKSYLNCAPILIAQPSKMSKHSTVVYKILTYMYVNTYTCVYDVCNSPNVMWNVECTCNLMNASCLNNFNNNP